MIKYYKMWKIHIFIEFLLGYWGIQIGTIYKSIGIHVADAKTSWHSGKYTICFSKRRYIGGNPENECDLEEWGMYSWKFIPVGIPYSNKISSKELYLKELNGENNWKHISLYNKLTNKQLEEFKNKINWDTISLRYKMSYKFIIKHRDVIVVDQLAQNNKISKRVKKKVLKYILNKI